VAVDQLRALWEALERKPQRRAKGKRRGAPEGDRQSGHAMGWSKKKCAQQPA
jgi:hypothetical protein